MSDGGVRIELRGENGEYTYTRASEGEVVEKVIASDGGNLVINPVEPVNIPSCVTNFVMLRFLRNVVMSPGHTNTVFVKFPVEIGVFVSGSSDIELIDVFSLTRPKYTLYGDPRNGIVCRYWETEIYSSPVQTDHLREGLMELRIVNRFDEWVEISKSVLNVYLMKIFYSDTAVFSKAEMEVNSKRSAETRFLMEPLSRDMKKAVEIFTPRKVQIVSKRFFMEWGL